jgi:uncharacterized protein
MMSRAEALIARLGLTPHPEGGYFREVYRSEREVDPLDGRGRRSAVTTILFLLVAGQVSAWHRVRSDEVWHFYEGDPLLLSWSASADGERTAHTLGPVGDGQSPVAVVPADCWQTARPLGDYALVGCTVGPGFDYEDFELAEV